MQPLNEIRKHWRGRTRAAVAVRVNLGKNGLIERADMDGRLLAVVVRKNLGQNGMIQRADKYGRLLAGSPTTGL